MVYRYQVRLSGSLQRLLAMHDQFGVDSRLAADDARVSPLKAADLSGLAPALVLTAGFDPLRHEGNEYAAVLRSAGVAVDHRQFDALTHGFASVAPFGGGSAHTMVATISAIRAHLSRS